MGSKRIRQHGAVSIFLVVFTALLVTIVTTSFIQIMLRNQKQATNNDLSQSAYDSALAGVEDAKRALVAYKKCLKDSSLTGCATIITAFDTDADSCTFLQSAGIETFTDGEVGVGDASLNQAYTCVKVKVRTESVEGKLDENGTIVIPLDTEGTDDDIETVEISWFNGGADGDLPTGLPNYSGITPTNLPQRSSWPATRPPIMRAQLIQFETGNFNLSDVADDARTRFLYPSSTIGSNDADFDDDTRDSDTPKNTPVEIQCNDDFSASPYLCTARVSIPSLANREAYLQLATIYGGAHYQVRLIDGSGDILDFDGVQPQVDSTGRAADLFRRVRANVYISSGGVDVPFPPAALAIHGSLCKDFFITDDGDDYRETTDTIQCDPAP